MADNESVFSCDCQAGQGPNNTRRKFRPLPPITRVAEVLGYDALSGKTWRIDGKRLYKNRQNYWVTTIGGEPWLVHRLAWLLFYGEDPAANQIDHINNTPDDNRISNLRMATDSQNKANRKAKRPGVLKGVQLRRGRFRARITHGGVTYQLGTFDTEHEAHACYMKAALEVFGEFASAG